MSETVERTNDRFMAEDFEHTERLLLSDNDAIRDATLSNNFNIILAALRTAVHAERDYIDMRSMQMKYIQADQRARDLAATLGDAAKIFRNYEALHNAKGTVDGAQKAAANAYSARQCESALARAGLGSAVGEKDSA